MSNVELTYFRELREDGKLKRHIDYVETLAQQCNKANGQTASIAQSELFFISNLLSSLDTYLADMDAKRKATQA